MKGRILLEVRSAQRGATADYLALLSSQSPFAMPSTLEMRSHGLSFRGSLQTGVSLRCRLCPAHAHCDSDEGRALRVMAPAWGMMSENADPLIDSVAWFLDIVIRADPRCSLFLLILVSPHVTKCSLTYIVLLKPDRGRHIS